MALDKKQIIQKVYNPLNDSLNGVSQGAATVPQPACYLSEKQIWKRVFDATANKIQTVRAS